MARATGLTLDPEAEALHGAEGQVTYQVVLELRGRELFAVARLRWPPAGLALQLAERRWLERLRRPRTSPLGDPAFERRFRLRAREEAQARALLGPEVRAALHPFARVSLDDHGAELASPNNGYTVQLLSAFARSAQQAVAALSRALDELPPPQALAAQADAWRALAAQLGGRFEPGGCAIREARYLGQPVELLTRFSASGSPEATLARVLLAAPLPGTAQPGADAAWLSAEARRVLRSLGQECESLRAGPEAVEARLPSPLTDPRQAESLWRALGRLAKALESAG